MAIQNLRDERASNIAAAEATANNAKAAGRVLTTAERQQIDEALARVDTLDKQIEGKALVDRVMSLGSAEEDHFAENGGGPFDTEAKAGLIRAVKSRTAFRCEVSRKALTSGTLLPAAGTGVVPGLHPNAMYALADLFPNQPAEGAVQRVYRTTAGTATTVAEGAEKVDSGTAFEAVDVALKKIVALAKVSDELSQDAPFLLTALAADLQQAVAARENVEIITAFGAAVGVLTDAGAAADVIDIVGTNIAVLEALNGAGPSAVIAHPNTVASVRALKASTAGSYHVDPWSAGPPSVHGVQLVSTAAVTAGTVWLVSSQAAVIYRRGPVSVEVGLDGTDFSFNMRTVIAEERMAAAVTRPGAIVEITLT
jgi:HK97 family phage major capsid protein